MQRLAKTAPLLVLLACGPKTPPESPLSSTPPTEPPTASADDAATSDVATEVNRVDCMIPDQIEPVLAPSQAGATVEVVHTPGQTTESFALPDGVPVRFVQGGCVDYGAALSFGLPKAPDNLYAAALQQSKRVVFTAPDGSLPTLLAAGGGLDDVGSFPCGDASCGVRWIDDDSGRWLVVEYDLAL